MGAQLSKERPQPQTTERILLIYQLMLRGCAHEKLLQFASSQGWGITERQLFAYKAEAAEMLRERAAAIADQAFEMSITRRELLFEMAITEKDVYKALAVEDSKCRVLQLFAPQQLEILTQEENPYAKLTKEEVKLALDALDKIKASSKVHPAPSDKKRSRPKSKPRNSTPKTKRT